MRDEIIQTTAQIAELSRPFGMIPSDDTVHIHEGPKILNKADL